MFLEQDGQAQQADRADKAGRHSEEKQQSDTVENIIIESETT